MQKVPTIGKTIAAALLAAATAAFAVGSRVGGSFDIEYESVNNGGISYATNGNVRLGGTIGQHGLIFIATNAGGTAQNGFWKAENGCEFYPVAFSQVLALTGQVAFTFNAMASNIYTVASITTEAGGPPAGTHAWTNVVLTLAGEGGIGSVTTVYNNVSALTNIASFYLIRCDPP